MSSELERRLAEALRRQNPSEAATGRARAGALDAVPRPPVRSLRTGHRLFLAATLCAAALAISGVTLAASGTVREAVGIGDAPPGDRVQQVPDTLPSGTNAVAAFSHHRLWLRGPSGTIARGGLSAVELSPGGLYVARGRGPRLEAVTPDLRRIVWSVGTPGPVVAASWSPYPVLIAYVVESGGSGFAVRLIEADGKPDARVDAQADDVTPAWRWDSKAFAYAAGDGSVVLRDLVHQRSLPLTLPASCPVARVRHLAFAPSRPLLAATLQGGTLAVINTATGTGACVMARASSAAWLSDRELIVSGDQIVARLGYRRGALGIRAWLTSSSTVTGLAVDPTRQRVAVAFRIGERTRVVEIHPPTDEQGSALVPARRLLDIPIAGPARLYWR